MNFNEIKELIGIVNDSELKYFQLNTGDVNMSMSKSDNIQLGENKQISSAPIQYEETVKPVQSKEESEPVSETKTEIKEGNIIKSPIVGTFYESLKPGSPAFKKKGDMVKKGEVVCIIEAMKIMNEITSEFDGIVDEILVSNEQVVEFGQPLFRIV